MHKKKCNVLKVMQNPKMHNMTSCFTSIAHSLLWYPQAKIYPSSYPNYNFLVAVFQIIARCDVCLLQEVRDSKERALPLLVDSINR